MADEVPGIYARRAVDGDDALDALRRQLERYARPTEEKIAELREWLDTALADGDSGQQSRAKSALHVLDQLETSDYDVFMLGVHVGIKVEQIQVLPLDELVKTARRTVRARRKKRRGLTTPQEREILISRIDHHEVNRSRSEAAKIVLAEVRQGQCPGINRDIPDLNSDAMRKWK